ncbi:isoprenyl transferase [Planococcus lenghuensis]|uniref:Isoprenyl transferase n=1 Tax=Planococcus lenghuensis TaxID=2213202 RepID=A0A1Q2L640_9BACL|nr:isoprenyl transferase [Planococcus lenghuensis]AQQ55557.1 hypothetical protein B0X71_20500 [Planococcus lenghuensis]
MIEGMPKHVAIMMDGNGRWAAERGLSRSKGHYKGMLAVKEVIQGAMDLGIKHLTLYAFSTENWTRPKEEVDYIMSLPLIFFKSEIANLMKNRIKVRFIGDIAALPEKTQRVIEETMRKTELNTGLNLNVAMNYGGRADIVQAVRKTISDAQSSSEKGIAIEFAGLQKHLWTGKIPDADLLIRTSGEKRISNFLLLQAAETELWFTDTYWPDFKKAHLSEAIVAYKERKLRHQQG